MAFVVCILAACKGAPPPASVPEQPEPKERVMDETAFQISVTRARYFETNYSIPPQDQSKDEWILHATEVEDWDDTITDLLDKTTVNGVMSVREHAQLLATNDVEGLKRLDLPDGVERIEPSGAPTIEFELYDGEKKVYQFRSGFDYEGPSYRSFIRLVQQKGKHISTPMGGHPQPVKTRVPEAD